MGGMVSWLVLMHGARAGPPLPAALYLTCTRSTCRGDRRLAEDAGLGVPSAAAAGGAGSTGELLALAEQIRQVTGLG